MSRKLTTPGIITKITREVGKAGEITKVSLILPGAVAGDVSIGNVNVTIQATQKELTFGMKDKANVEDDE